MAAFLSKKTKIGFIGIGVMGVSMCGRMMAAGYSMTIYNRTKSKANSLIKKGAIWANSPAEVAAASDIIFTIVGYPQDVEEVYFGEKGILSTAKSGSILIDMTTTKPSFCLLYTSPSPRDS